MNKEIVITQLPNGVKVGEYEPGNSTNYKAIAVPWSLHKSMNWLGTIREGWLIVSCMASQRAYLFPYPAYLPDFLIQEHLGGSDGDYPHFGDLVRKLVVG